MERKRFIIEYSLSDSAAYSYIQTNGEGEKLFGTGKAEIIKGDFLLVYASSGGEVCIEKNGAIVAQKTNGEITFEYYPESDAVIEAKTAGALVGTRIAITEK